MNGNSDTVTYAYNTYVDKAHITSFKRMRMLLGDILSTVKACRIVLDGIDECSVDQQKEIISTFLAIQKEAADSCKVLFSCRNDESHIKGALLRMSVISMKGQTGSAISLYVGEKVNELSNVFGGLDGKLLADIQQHLCSKAEGKRILLRCSSMSLIMA